MIVLIGFLILFGLLLIFCEIFIPGGIVGFFGVALMMIGIGLIFSEYGIMKGISFFFLCAIAVVVLVAIAINRIPRSQAGQWLILGEEVSRDNGYHADANQQDVLPGYEGLAESDLRPAGVAMIGGRRLDVMTEGDYIEAQARIRVHRVDGNRIVVTRA